MAEEGQISSKKVALILIAIYLFTLFLSLYVINNNFSIYHHELRNILFSTNLTELRHIFLNPQPNLPFIFPTLLFNIFSPSLNIALIQNHILLAIFIISNYKLGKRLFNQRVAILSTFISTTVPLFFGFHRTFSYKFASLAFIPLLTLILIKTNGFKKKSETVKFFLLLFFSINFSENILISIIPLLTFYIAYSYLKNPESVKNVFHNNKLIISLCAIIGITILLNHPERICGMLITSGCRPLPEMFQIIFSINLSRLFENTNYLFSQFKPLYTFILVPSIIYFLYKTSKEKDFSKFLTSFMVITPILFLSTFLHKQHSIHILSVLPFIVFTMAYSLDKLYLRIKDKKYLSKIFIIALILIFAINSIIISLNYDIYTPIVLNAQSNHYNGEIRYTRSNDYKEVFNKINSYESPKIGIINGELASKKFDPHWATATEEQISFLQTLNMLRTPKKTEIKLHNTYENTTWIIEEKSFFEVESSAESLIKNSDIIFIAREKGTDNKEHYIEHDKLTKIEKLDYWDHEVISFHKE